MKYQRQWSLLKRLVLLYGCSVLLLVIVGNISQYWLLNGLAEADRSAILSDRMSAIATLLKTPDRGQDELLRRVRTEWPTRGGEKTFLRIVDGQNREIVHTPDFPNDLWRDSEQERGKLSAPPKLLHLTAGDGQTYMARAESFTNNLGWPNPVYVFGSISGDVNRSFMERFRQIAISIVIASLVVSLVIGWQIAQKGISPLRRMTEIVSRIHTKTLHERVLIEDLPIELHQLATAFNETLDKLEEAFGRLSRFSSDIAHELRTPLANMMGEMEVALARPRTAADYEAVLTSNLEEGARLKQTIESLLFLARAENLENSLAVESIDGAGELAALVEFYEPSATIARMELTFNGAAALILAERTLFQRAIGNLISNAIRYTTVGGRVRVVIRDSEGESSFVEIEVIDNGPGIASEHLKRIFDRFYRVDSARTGSSGGVGLGLSIVKSIVERHKGRIEIFSDQRGTRVLVQWPKAPLATKNQHEAV